MFRKYFLIGCLFLSSCAAKEEIHNISLAANRRFGLVVRSLQGSPLETYFYQLNERALKEAYGSQVQSMHFTSKQTLEDPENLYQVGSNEIDDLILLDVTVSGNFTPPPSSQPLPKNEEVLKASPGAPMVEVSATVYNGGNLRTIAVFKTSAAFDRPEYFEAEYFNRFKQSALKAYPNPNIYPKSDPEHFANLLYVLSQQREKDIKDDLTCENAPTALQFYPKAAELFQLAEKRGISQAFGQQTIAGKITAKRTESEEKAQTLKTCGEDRFKKFEFNIDFGKMNPAHQDYIRQAFSNIQMEDLLKRYTDKPVTARFQINAGGSINLALEMRFDRNRYRFWTKDRIPYRWHNFQVVSLDPYYALMQKLVVLRTSLPIVAPAQLKSAFKQLQTTLFLKTLFNGDIYFGVDGVYDPEQKFIKMSYPNTIYLTTPGYENRPIANKNPEIFQEKGWLAIGNCKTLEGVLTEDGLLYKFFGFPCE